MENAKNLVSGFVSTDGKTVVEVPDTRDSTTRLAAKMFAARADIPRPARDGVNPFFKNNYPTLGSVLAAIDPALQKHGLLLMQPVEIREIADKDRRCLVTRIIDIDTGNSTSSVYPLSPACEGNPQEFAACVTYAMRYSLMSLFSLAADDDDGNMAAGRTHDGNMAAGRR